MDAFTFTRKKFLQMPSGSRHRHVIGWLSGIYQKLAANRMGKDSCDLFYVQYADVLSWMDLSCPPKPAGDDSRIWMEFVSDAVNRHRMESGTAAADSGLLQPVGRGDRPDTGIIRHAGDYHIALDGLRSVFNVGAVFRICDAAGFQSVILGNTPGKEHPKLRKTAMGAQEWINQETTADLADTLLRKKAAGYPVIGLETVAGSRAFTEFSWPRRGVVLFGNEEYGISSHVLPVCDAVVHIPMYGRKNSINVACAVSVICFHIAGTLPPAD